MRKFLFFALIIIWTLKLSYAQNVTIYGQAPSYKKKQLTAYKFTDRITFSTAPLASCLVDTGGNFNFSFSVSDTQLIFIDLETTRGFIYVAPGKKYWVLLPKYQPISLEQQLSPYFQPQYLRLYIINQDTNSLNFLIAKFDKQFNDLLGFVAKNPNISKDTLSILIHRLDSSFHSQMLFFNNYKKYRNGLLELTSTKFKKIDIARKYFFNSKILWRNPAYFTLFNNLFDNCLNPQNTFFNPLPAIKALAHQDLSAMADSLQTSLSISNKNFAYLLTLKGLYDLFFSYKYLQEDIIKAFENSMDYLPDTNLTILAQNIYTQITRMRIGYPPPHFALPNRFGIKRSLKDYKGKFIYLNFCYPQTLGCQQQLPILEKYYQSAPKDFEIITIMFGQTKKQFRKFLREHHQYKWVFLYGGDDKTLLRRYNVVAFPTYYLIDPDGNLVANPAPAPIENFEQVFSSIYRSWHKKQKQSKEQSVISNHYR